MSEELVTILLTDVEGACPLHVAKGDAAARTILVGCQEVVRQQVQAAGGREIKSLGDGLLVTFGSPLAAVVCALAIQDALRDHRDRHPGQGLRVRAGIHAGLAVEEAGELFGSAVFAAARIADKARGDEVLVSAVVRQLCGSAPGVAFEERGYVRLKGFPQRWRLYRVVPRAQGIPAGDSTVFTEREGERLPRQPFMTHVAGGQDSLAGLAGERHRTPLVRRTLSEELGVELGAVAHLRESPGTESVLATFMLTDIEGSTAAWEEEPALMAVALARHDSLVAEAVDANGGQLLKTRGEGDSTFSVFGRASAAVRAAWALRHALTAEPWPTSTPLRIRTAIHTGEAEIRDGDYFGRAVNRAARLRSVASGGQVLLSRGTADLVADILPAGATLVYLGGKTLRDLRRPEYVFELRTQVDADGVLA